MRQLIITKGERFDIETVRLKIEGIADSFNRYLDEYRPKTTRTMHGVMGPVPMILDGARVRKEDAQTLVGKAVRAHEMNENNRGYLSPSALKALETGTQDLLTLCSEVPITAVSKVTDRIRYSIYYVRRKKEVQRYEDTKTQFANFLRQRYSSDSELATSWAEDFSLEHIPYPSRKAATGGNDAKQKDMNDFWQHVKGTEIEDLEEDHNE